MPHFIVTVSLGDLIAWGFLALIGLAVGVFYLWAWWESRK